jgi:hypothetical protein
MTQSKSDRRTEHEEDTSGRNNRVAAKVGKRVGSAALRGAASTARFAGRAAVGGGKAAWSSGRRTGKRRND